MRFLSIDQIKSDNNWTFLESERVSKIDLILSHNEEYLFAYNFSSDRCEIMIGNYERNYCHPGGGCPNYATWVAGTMQCREEISISEVVGLADVDFVTAYFSIKKGTGRVSDLLKLNEIYYSSPDFCDQEGDAVYEIQFVKYYHILPNEIDEMTRNGVVEICGGISGASYSKVFDKIEI